MRAIIEGRLYDTAKARLVFESISGDDTGDLAYCEEALYRTAPGRFFLAGAGGPMSPYAKYRGANERAGGSRIDPLSPSEARQWLEDNVAPAEVIGRFFPVVEA